MGRTHPLRSWGTSTHTDPLGGRPSQRGSVVRRRPRMRRPLFHALCGCRRWYQAPYLHKDVPPYVCFVSSADRRAPTGAQESSRPRSHRALGEEGERAVSDRADGKQRYGGTATDRYGARRSASERTCEVPHACARCVAVLRARDV